MILAASAKSVFTGITKLQHSAYSETTACWLWTCGARDPFLPCKLHGFLAAKPPCSHFDCGLLQIVQPSQSKFDFWEWLLLSPRQLLVPQQEKWPGFVANCECWPLPWWTASCQSSSWYSPLQLKSPLSFNGWVLLMWCRHFAASRWRERCTIPKRCTSCRSLMWPRAGHKSKSAWNGSRPQPSLHGTSCKTGGSEMQQ